MLSFDASGLIKVNDTKSTGIFLACRAVKPRQSHLGVFSLFVLLVNVIVTCLEVGGLNYWGPYLPAFSGPRMHVLLISRYTPPVLVKESSA